MSSKEHDSAVEKSLCGGMFQAYAQDQAEVFATLVVQDFATHAAIFGAMRSLYDQGQPIESHRVSVLSGIPDSVIGAIEVDCPTGANVVHHAKDIRKASMVRQAIRLAKAFEADVQNPKIEIGQVLAAHTKAVVELHLNTGWKRPKRLKEIEGRYLDAFNARLAEGPTKTGISTGVYHFDDMLGGGFKPTSLNLLAAGTGGGKSAMAIAIAAHTAREQSNPVMFVSLEMQDLQIIERMVASHGRLKSTAMAQPWKHGKDLVEDVVRALKKFTSLPIWIDDAPGLTIYDIHAKARMLKIQDGLKLVVVDYVQLVHASGRHQNREREVASISRGLKNMAMELDIAVLGLSQFSRAPDTRQDPHPMLSDLRESGALEQDADTAMFIYRPKDEDTKAEILVAKNRGGRTSRDWVQTTFDGEYYLFGSQA